MSFSEKPIVRAAKSKSDAEDYSLPKWDREGNLIARATKPQRSVKVDDVKTEEIKPPTVAELKAIREQAYNEGFELGYEQGMGQGSKKGEKDGHAKGLKQGQEEGLKIGEEKGFEEALKKEQTETAKKLELYDSLNTALKEQINSEAEELKNAMLGLSIRIARQVLQDELKANPEHIQSIVHAAVQALPNPDDKLSIQVNSSDADLVKSFAESHWVIEENAAISQGGCKVKSGYSYIDYTLEHRFDTAVSHLINHTEQPLPEKVKKPIAAESLLSPESDLKETPNESNEIEQPAKSELGVDESVNPLAEEGVETIGTSEPMSAPKAEASDDQIVDQIKAEEESQEVETVVEQDEKHGQTSEPESALNEETPTEPDSQSGDPALEKRSNPNIKADEEVASDDSDN